MPTLTYWIARHPNDHECYSLIAKTKKECQALVEMNQHVAYETPVKRVIQYRDAFDLFEWATGEGGGRYSAGTTPA